MGRSTDEKSSPSALLPVPAFDADLLPEALRPWAVDIAKRMQCPLDFVAVALMIVLAAVVGRRVGIRPKQRDSWTVIPNLWGLLIGRPGIMKSPPMKEACRPLTRLEIAEAERYKEAARQYEKLAMVQEQRKKAAEAAIRKAVKDGKTDPDKIANDAIDEEEAPPVRRRFTVNDPTTEKLQEILLQNPNGVAVLRDEAQGFLRSLDKPGREDARAFYLECWAGDGRFTVDRIERGTLDIPACCVSILATIQPGPLHSYLWKAHAGGEGDDGLLPRFQLAVWPDIAQAWKNVDEWPNKTAKQKAFDTIERLTNLVPHLIDAAPDDDDDGVPFLRFSAEAQTQFNEWRANLEKTLRAGTLTECIESVLAKYRSLVPSIALLIHLADKGRGPVGVAALDMAIGWAWYLFAHAQRIYGSAETDDAAEDDRLEGIIQGMGGDCAPRDLVRGAGGYRNTVDAEAALNRLVLRKRGVWLVLPPDPQGGPPPRRFRLRAQGAADKTLPNPRNKRFCQQDARADGENGPDFDEANRQLAEAAEADGERVPY